MAEWFEDESFWVKLYPLMFPEKKFSAADEQVEQLVGILDFSGSDVLDLCCGPGRHSISFAKRGFRVTGVDRTAFLLEKAKGRAREEGVDVEWILEDMRDFNRPGAFDLVINMFTSFGYFDNKDDDLKVLKNAYECLRPGGIFIIDVHGKERLAQIFHPTTSEELDNGSLLIQRHEIFDEWTRMRNEWILIENERATTFRFHLTLYSGQELKDRLLDAGFSRVRLWGDLEGSEYGMNSKRLIAVADKTRK